MTCTRLGVWVVEVEDAGRLWPCRVAAKFRAETQHPHIKRAGQHAQSHIKWTHPFWRSWTAFPTSSTLPGQTLVANLSSLRLPFLLAPQCLLPFSHTDIKRDCKLVPLPCARMRDLKNIHAENEQQPTPEIPCHSTTFNSRRVSLIDKQGQQEKKEVSWTLWTCSPAEAKNSPLCSLT